MKTIRLILKGILLYVTLLTIICFISCVDVIYNNGWFIQSIITCAVLCYTSYKLISGEELETLTFYKYFEKLEE